VLAAGLIPFLSASNSKGKAIFESFCFNPFSVRSFIRFISFMWDGVLFFQPQKKKSAWRDPNNIERFPTTYFQHEGENSHFCVSPVVRYHIAGYGEHFLPVTNVHS
jgi:hypothetical protein